MTVEQARIRVSVLGGLVADLSWLTVVRVPPGVTVEVVDFGYRVTVIVTRGTNEVTVAADLGTGDVATSMPQSYEPALVEYAQFVLAARMGVDGSGAGDESEIVTGFTRVIELSGADWVQPRDAGDGAVAEGH